MLANEEKKMLPKVSQVPTCIFGLDVSHGSPGDASSPSIAAVSFRFREKTFLLLS